MTAILISGTALMIAGWYGPEDGGLLALIGLILVVIAVVNIL